MAKRFSVSVRVAGMIAVLVYACLESSNEVRGQDKSAASEKKRAVGEEEAKEQRKARLEEMRRRADGASVAQLAGAEKIAAKLLPEPVLRYSGEFHGIVDATVWVYGDKGRPVAIEKVELYKSWHHGYFYCLASLCDERVEAHWPGVPVWRSSRPGVEMRDLPDGPTPAATETARTRQIKELARRFTATRIDAGDIREENRLLVQPIHRYRDPEKGLLDGAIFAFIANGTNPDFMLLIELSGTDRTHAAWRYGAARMTTGELHLRIDGNEVWTVPWQDASGFAVWPTYVHFPVFDRPPTGVKSGD